MPLHPHHVAAAALHPAAREHDLLSAPRLETEVRKRKRGDLVRERADGVDDGRRPERALRTRRDRRRVVPPETAGVRKRKRIGGMATPVPVRLDPFLRALRRAPELAVLTPFDLRLAVLRLATRAIRLRRPHRPALHLRCSSSRCIRPLVRPGGLDVRHHPSPCRQWLRATQLVQIVLSCPALVIPRFVFGKRRPAALGLLIGFHFIQLDFPFHLRKGNRHAPIVLVGIDRVRLAPVREVPRDDRRNGLHAPSQQTLLQRVEVLQAPRRRVVGHVLAEEPLVHEILETLVPEVRRDNRVEERAVLLVDEEVELVRGVLAVQFAFLLVALPSPIRKEAEFGERAASARVEREKELVKFAHGRIALRVPGVGKRVEPLLHAQVERRERHGRPRKRNLVDCMPVGDDHRDVLHPRRLREIDLDKAVLTGFQVREHRHRIRQEIAADERPS